MEICTPLTVDPVAEFVLFALWEVNCGQPGAVERLFEEVGAEIPVVEVTSQGDLVRPDRGRNEEIDANVAFVGG